MKNQKAYRAEDFLRYHKGEMTAEEMHQLEKAALSDPFLSDALDGFSDKSLYERRKLLNELQRTKINPLPKTSSSRIIKYVSIAAILSGIILSILQWSKEKAIKSSPLVIENDSREKLNQKDSSTLLLAQNDQTDNKKSIQEETKNATASNQKEKQKESTATLIKEEKPESKSSELIVQEVHQSASIESPQSNLSIVKADAEVTNNLNVEVESLQQDKSIVPAKLSVKKMGNANVEEMVRYLQKALSKKENTPSFKLPDTLHISFIINRSGKPDQIMIRENLPESLKEKIGILIEKGPLENIPGPIELTVPLN